MLAFACWGFWLSSTCWWCKLESQGVASSLIKCFPAKRKANKCQKSCLCVRQDDLRRPSQQIVFRVRVPFWVKMTKSPKQLTWCCPPVGCPDYTFLSFQFCVCLFVPLSALLHLPVLLPSTHTSITGRRGDPDFRLTGSRCISLPRHIRNVHIRWLKGFFLPGRDSTLEPCLL